jgi:hypothetical protein
MPPGLSYGRTNAASMWKACPRPETAHTPGVKSFAPAVRSYPRGQSCTVGKMLGVHMRNDELVRLAAGTKAAETSGFVL